MSKRCASAGVEAHETSQNSQSCLHFQTRAATKTRTPLSEPRSFPGFTADFLMWRKAVLKMTTDHPVEKLGTKVMNSLDWTVQAFVDGRNLHGSPSAARRCGVDFEGLVCQVRVATILVLHQHSSRRCSSIVLRCATRQQQMRNQRPNKDMM